MDRMEARRNRRSLLSIVQVWRVSAHEVSLLACPPFTPSLLHSFHLPLLISRLSPGCSLSCVQRAALLRVALVRGLQVCAEAMVQWRAFLRLLALPGLRFCLTIMHAWRDWVRREITERNRKDPDETMRWLIKNGYGPYTNAAVPALNATMGASLRRHYHQDFGAQDSDVVKKPEPFGKYWTVNPAGDQKRS